MISVSNIERFATRDGPGIRTTVFLKGCPLHCPWCANPETWQKEPVLMHMENKCVHCRICESVCPQHAISFEEQMIRIRRESCDHCGQCAEACLNSALSINGTYMENEAVLKEVLKDLDYYRESGGGVTFSGGEPLFQKEAAVSLIRQAKESGLHVAIETTGVCEPSLLQQAEPYIDLFLFDIKHVNAEKLSAVTGAPFEIVQKNFEYLCEKRGGDVIARVPVIPGFNREDLDEILTFIKAHPVRAVNLLPFHNLGKTKWHQLQKDYAYEEASSLSAKELEPYRDELVTIGG